MVLFEDDKIRKETISYAVELARRLESGICVLMLMADGKIESKRGIERNLHTVLETIKKHGIATKGEIRCGDKTSEFLKFLALNHRLSAIVWGSNDNVITKHGGKSGHWLTRAARHLECSIVSPTIKNF